MENKNAQSDIRLLLGIFVIMFGAIGIMALGLGVMLNNSALAWFGGLLTSAIGIVASTIQKFIK